MQHFIDDTNRLLGRSSGSGGGSSVGESASTRHTFFGDVLCVMESLFHGVSALVSVTLSSRSPNPVPFRTSRIALSALGMLFGYRVLSVPK